MRDCRAIQSSAGGYSVVHYNTLHGEGVLQCSAVLYNALHTVVVLQFYSVTVLSVARGLSGARQIPSSRMKKVPRSLVQIMSVISE